MNIIDKMVRAYQNNETMPLKGHTKITLTDVRTGEVKTVEKDNMVTNAVADIFAKNWCGLAKFSQLLPLKNLFSGVLCFEGEVTELATNFNPPNSTSNDQICHAGPDAHSTGDASRGQPNVAEQVVTDTSIKFVWDFTTSVQGEIRTVCLVPGIFGDMGLKPYNTEYNPLSSFGGDGRTNRSWSETVAKEYPFNIANDGKSATMLWVDGSTFTEKTIRHDYLAFGIMRDAQTYQDVNTRTASLLESFVARKSFIFDDDTYYYVCRAYDSDTINLQKVKKSDMTVSFTPLNYTGVSFYTGDFNSSAKNNCWRLWGFDGTYLYYPNSDLTKFYKINIANTADVELIPETLEIHIGVADVAGSVGQQWSSPITIAPGLILGDNYIINGSHAYQIAQCKQVGTNSGYGVSNRWLDIVKSGAACYGNAFTAYSGSIAEQCAVFNQMFLSTINVLDEAVVKTTSTTMKIEYTLTEV